MVNNSITVLTSAIPERIIPYCYNTGKTIIKKYLMGFKRNDTFHPIYGGHQAVTRSLISGLDKINVEYNYNPRRISDLNENVIVLTDINALRQLIRLKRKGRINRLFAGPNLVILPSDNIDLITAKEIDKLIVPSQWVYGAYSIDAPSLSGRCIVWPAGVDARYWKPKQMPESQRSDILFYIKNVPQDLIEPYRQIVQEEGYNITTIVYGEYNSKQYLGTLQRCKVAIFFTKTESQGVALAEAWSVNIPTIVYRVNEWIHKDYPGKVFPASSAPYLSPSTGLFFSNEEDFRECLQNVLVSEKNRFSPRKWVLSNMTDEICAKNLIYSILRCD